MGKIKLMLFGRVDNLARVRVAGGGVGVLLIVIKLNCIKPLYRNFKTLTLTMFITVAVRSHTVTFCITTFWKNYNLELLKRPVTCQQDFGSFNSHPTIYKLPLESEMRTDTFLGNLEVHLYHSSKVQRVVGFLASPARAKTNSPKIALESEQSTVQIRSSLYCQLGSAK